MKVLKMNLLSLFSGCGGMDLGFEGNFYCLKESVNQNLHPEWIKENAGEWILLKPTAFNIVFANDINKEAKTTWVSYFAKRNSEADSVYHLGSIIDLVKKEQIGESVFPQNIDIVTGGFPCQDFSTAGKRQGFSSKKSHLGEVIEEPSIENRGHLYMWMREVITLVAPKMFVAENVKGLKSLKGVKETIENDFSEACNGGYLVIPARTLSAADYGVPQLRERIIFFGFRKNALKEEALEALEKEEIPSEYDPYPDKTHGDGLAPKVTCANALKDLAEPELSKDIDQQKYSKAKFLGNKMQGQIEIKLNSVAPTIRSEHHGNIEYRRLSLEHGGTHYDELSLGLNERRLTVRECARLQTFPDDYRFIYKKNENTLPVSASDAYKLIGNAVPPVLAYNIAKNLEIKWTKYFGGTTK